MKKTALIGMLLVLTASMAFAGHRDSDLKLSVFQNKLFTVQLDGRYYSRPVSNLVIRDVEPGRHFLTVKDASGRRVIFKGFVHVQGKSIIRARIDNRGRFVVKNVAPKPGRQGQTVILNGGGSCTNPSVSQPIGYYEGYAAGGQIGNSHMSVLGSAGFQGLLYRIEMENRDDNRLRVMLDALHRNLFTSDQVLEMMYLLHKEHNRLDLAKSAYSVVIDPGNYHIVTQAFRWERSSDELWDFIQFGY
jgi:hypothetical protein